MADFYISYAPAESAWATWIAWQMEQVGKSVVIEVWDFRPGTHVLLARDRALREADRVLVLLSPTYLASGSVQPQWAAAFQADDIDGAGRVVPVRVEPCIVGGLLGGLRAIELVGLSEEVAAEALLSGLDRERVRPPVAPQFPGLGRVSDSRSPPFPGTFPFHWNVPHGQNRNFTGRDDELAALRTALAADRASVVTQAITGLGGLGKTQLVVEYAYRHAAEFEVVWWVVAEDPATLAGQYAAFAAQLDLPERGEADQSIIVEAVRRWFREHDRWLLVFDNATDPEDIHPYVPHGGGGSVLITSRNPAWRGLATPLPLGDMDEDSAADLLLKRSGRTDVGPAKLLAHELGYLPLALEQAAAYIEATGISFRTYLDGFRRSPAPLLAEGAPLGYEQTVATTWALAFTRVEEESPAGAELLRFCAFLAPDAIPRDLLVDGVEYLPPALSTAIAEDHLDEAVGVLRRYSLLEVRDESFSFHRLVQLVTRQALDDEARRDWVQTAMRLLFIATPDHPEEPANWPTTARLLPHALVATQYAEVSGGQETLTGALLNHMGVYLGSRALFTEAEEVLRRALRFQELTHAADHPWVAKMLCNLGSVLRGQGDLAGARAHLERALRIDETAYGPDHPEVAMSLASLGSVLRQQGNLAGARAHLERALRILETAYGPDHPEVAMSLASLGSVLHDQRDLDGARLKYERALRILETAYGSDHFTAANTLASVGDVLREQGHLSEARAMLERALRIQQSTYGPNHFEVAATLNNLGIVLKRQGDLDMARAHLERALHISEAAYGPDHPEVAPTLGELGNVLRLQGDIAGALGLIARALPIFQEHLGLEHRYTVMAKRDLDALLRLADDLTE